MENDSCSPANVGVLSKTMPVAAPGQVRHLETLVGRPLHIANHHVMAALLQHVDEVLRAEGIPYWMSGGSLIGALRHGNIVPHDDDIDIECLESDLPRLAAAIHQGIPNAYVVHTSYWFGAKVYQICKRAAATTFCIDVFPRPKDDANGNAKFPSMQEVFPLRRCSFAGSCVSIPADVSVLGRLYGSRWCEEVHVWNHTEDGEDKLKAPLLPLEEYTDIVRRAGYVEPSLARSAALSWHALSEHLALIHAARREEGQELLDCPADMPWSCQLDWKEAESLACSSEHQWRQRMQLWLLQALDRQVAIECFEEDMPRLLEAARRIEHATALKPQKQWAKVCLYDPAAGIEVCVHMRPRDVSEGLPRPGAPCLSEADLLPLCRRLFAGMQLPCPAASDTFLRANPVASHEEHLLEECKTLPSIRYAVGCVESWETLSAAGGPLERLLWSCLGWASPLGAVIDEFDSD